MERENHEVILSVEEIKEIKKNIEARALDLRDGWEARPEEWIVPSDYGASFGQIITEKEREERIQNAVKKREEQKKGKDEKKRDIIITKSMGKRNNKYIHAWFGNIFSDVVQSIKNLPPKEEFRTAVEGRVDVLWQEIEQDFARIEAGENKMSEDFINSDEFKSFYGDIRLCPDGCRIPNEQIYPLYAQLRQGAVNLLFDYFWNFEVTRNEFDDNVQDFKNYFADKITPLVDKLQKMKKQYVAHSSEAVQAGDEILKIVIFELQK